MAQLSAKEIMLLGRMVDRIESEIKSNQASLDRLDASSFANDAAYERRLNYLQGQYSRLKFVLDGLNSLIED